MDGLNRVAEIVDETLARMEREGASMVSVFELPDEMIDEAGSAAQGMQIWRPVPSIVTDEDLDAFEQNIEQRLPPSYRVFLKHKHFAELFLRDPFVWFPQHLPDRRLQWLLNRLVGPGRDYFLDRGFIEFASLADSGALCFDTNRPQSNNEWIVVYVDNDDFELGPDYAPNFLALLESDEGYSSRYIDRLNDFRASRYKI